MKKVNKIVASLLVGSMVLPLAACGNAEGTGATTPSSSTAASSEATPASSTSEASTEPAEVVKPESIKVMWDGTVFREGENYAEEFYAAMEEALGIDIEWVRPDHSSYPEQVGIAFNDANTLADVVILPSNYYASYASQGSLWNMTDAWLNSETANSGRLTDSAAQVIEGWYVPGPDGEKGIYGMYPARGNGCITYVKAAWAEAAGYTEDTLPTTWAEYQEFLLAMKDATGKAPVLAAGLVTTEAPYTNYLPEFYQDAYPEFYKNADGVWVDGFSEQAMIDALDRLAWGYENGVIEASILEGPSTSDVRNKFYDDTTGIFTYWAGTWAYNLKSNLEKKNVDSELWYLEPIDELGSYIERLSPMITITSTCDNPEGVFTYFVDKILDGGEVQMLWQYGVADVHYKWNEDGKTITGLPTQATKGAEKETLTTKNLFEANLKLANFAEIDPYVPADDCIDASFELFNATSVPAVEINSSEVYRSYSADLWTIKQQLIADATQGKITGAEAIEQYNEQCGAIVTAILDSFNN